MKRRQAQGFATQFGSFVVEGDHISCIVDGIEFRARLEHDWDCRPEDADCYTKRQIQAWKDDQWHYFGLVVSAHVDGIELGDFASLWGIEGNFPSRRKNPNKCFLEVANELLTEAIESAKTEASRIRSVLEKVAA